MTVPDPAPQPGPFDRPYLPATTGQGDEVLDPSEDALHTFVSKAEEQDDHVIMESLLPESDGRYAQTVRLRSSVRLGLGTPC